MTKLEKEQAAILAQDMHGWTTAQWQSFHVHYAKAEETSRLHAIDKEACKSFLIETGSDEIKAASHRAYLTHKEGSTEVDWDGVATELAAKGIDFEALKARHTRKKPGTVAFSFR